MSIFYDILILRNYTFFTLLIKRCHRLHKDYVNKSLNIFFVFAGTCSTRRLSLVGRSWPKISRMNWCQLLSKLWGHRTYSKSRRLCWTSANSWSIVKLRWQSNFKNISKFGFIQDTVRKKRLFCKINFMWTCMGILYLMKSWLQTSRMLFTIMLLDIN